jgi:DNA-binding MarR family transcriptional regulator
MATYRINKNRDNPYVMLNKEFLKRSDLSMKAKGLLAYFLSLPNNWKIIRRELPNNFKDKITAISNAINELEEAGYIVKYHVRTATQKFNGIVYDVYEIPCFENSIRIKKDP